MTRLVVDASVAMKWVVEEDGTPEALALLKGAELSAPDSLVAECANALWRKVRKSEFTTAEALVAAGLLESNEVELVSTRPLLRAGTRIALELNHPAYDCLYLALALANRTDFVPRTIAFCESCTKRGGLISAASSSRFWMLLPDSECRPSGGDMATPGLTQNSPHQ